jgi:hypothetical protein
LSQIFGNSPIVLNKLVMYSLELSWEVRGVIWTGCSICVVGPQCRRARYEAIGGLSVTYPKGYIQRHHQRRRCRVNTVWTAGVTRQRGDAVSIHSICKRVWKIYFLYCKYW